MLEAKELPAVILESGQNPKSSASANSAIPAWVYSNPASIRVACL
jgi:hypothetical protein